MKPNFALPVARFPGSVLFGGIWLCATLVLSGLLLKPAIAVAAPLAPTMQVTQVKPTPEAAYYVVSGGTVSYDVVISYTGTPSALGLRVVTPSTWSYTSTTGTNAPVCLDAVGAKQGDSTEGFGWFYFTAPTSEARFTVRFTYPAGQTGDMAVSFTGICFDNTGPAVLLAPAVAVPALLAPLTAPVITSQPVSATVTVTTGVSASFSVGVTGGQTFQWSKEGKAIFGATDNHYTLSSPTMADAGSYTVTVTNAKGAVTSTSAILTVIDAPRITTQPKGITVVPGDSFTLSVQASSAVAVTYQWSKDSNPIPGATSATYSAVGAAVANTGYYSVAITNSAGNPIKTTTSDAVIVQVAPAGIAATQREITTPGRGYTAGSVLRITNTFTFPARATALGWTVMLPAGFSLASDTTGAFSKPATNTTGKLDWAWDASALTSPLTFTYTLNVPSGATGDKFISAIVSVRINNETWPFIVTPDQMKVAQAGLPHSSDLDQDWRISVDELAQTIVIFNTSNNAVRTGAYKYASSQFISDSTVATAVPDAAHIHSADTSGDGAIDLKELLQVIDLYNYHNGTERTGNYHWQIDETGSGADKYAPGP